MSWQKIIFSFPLRVVTVCAALSLLVAAEHSWAQESAADVLTAEATLAYDDGNLDEALTLLNQALGFYPNHSEALYYLGLIYLNQDRLDESLAALQEAYELVPKSPSVAFQLGVVHFTREEYEEAETLLSQVFEVQPTTQNAGYYVGFLRYRNADYQGALDAFKVGASDDSRILQLTKFYSGLALVQLGLPQQAAEELEEAMRLRTVSPLIGPADRLRDTLIAAQQTDHRLTGQVRVGGFFDTNASVVPLETNDLIIRNLRNRDTNSPGILTSLRLDYSLLRLGALETTVGYSFFNTTNTDFSDLNVTNHLGTLSTFYRTSVATMPGQVGIRLSADNTELGHDPFLKRYSAALFATLVESARHVTTFQGRVQIKEFKETNVSQFADPAVQAALAADTRSGANWMGGMTHILRFEGGRHYLKGGFQFDRDAALGSNFDYKGYRFQAGGLYTLPWWNIRVRYDYDLYFRNYENVNTRFSRTSLLPIGALPVVKPKVTEQNHVVRIEKPLPYDITVALEWQGTFSRSNIDVLYDFNRQLVTGSVAWAFSLF